MRRTKKIRHRGGYVRLVTTGRQTGPALFAPTLESSPYHLRPSSTFLRSTTLNRRVTGHQVQTTCGESITGNIGGAQRAPAGRGGAAVCAAGDLYGRTPQLPDYSIACHTPLQDDGLTIATSPVGPQCVSYASNQGASSGGRRCGLDSHCSQPTMSDERPSRREND